MHFKAFTFAKGIFDWHQLVFALSSRTFYMPDDVTRDITRRSPLVSSLALLVLGKVWSFSYFSSSPPPRRSHCPISFLSIISGDSLKKGSWLDCGRLQEQYACYEISWLLLCLYQSSRSSEGWFPLLQCPGCCQLNFYQGRVGKLMQQV